MRRVILPVVGVTLLGLLLRLFILSQRGSFWFDEAFSVHFASMDIGQMLSYLRFENNPPLYFILLHFWMKLFGSSELAVRSLSMIFGLAAIPLIYALGAHIHSRTAGLFAAFLLAVSSFQVFYATETRMYSMYLFLTLAVMWLFVRQYGVAQAVRTDFKAKALSYIPLWVALLLLVWTHITAWFIVLAILVYLFWQSRFNLKQFIIHNSKFIILGALLVLQFLPWAINFIRLKIVAPLSQGYFFHIPPDKNYFIDILETFVVFEQESAFIVTLASVLMGILLWFALRGQMWLSHGGKWLSHDTFSTRLLLCWLFVPLFIGFAFSNAIPRYFIAVAPALYLLMGIGFARYREAEPPKLRRLGLLFPIIVFALVIPDYPSLAKVGHHEWNKLAGWVEQQSNATCYMLHVTCLILVNPHSEILPFERYYKGGLPVIGFYPRDDSDDRDARIVKTNWVSINTKENVPRLRDLTKDYDRVFLVTGGIDPIGRNLVPIWFWENGWSRVSAQEFGRLGVMELQRMSF